MNKDLFINRQRVRLLTGLRSLRSLCSCKSVAVRVGQFARCVRALHLVEADTVSNTLSLSSIQAFRWGVAFRVGPFALWVRAFACVFAHVGSRGGDRGSRGGDRGGDRGIRVGSTYNLLPWAVR